MITDSLLFKESGQYDKEIIQRLYLTNLGLTRINNLDHCVSLVELVLSCNEIGIITGLDSLASLRILDLSYNRIRKIENLKGLMALESLDLRGNQITSLDDISELAQLPNLKILNLKGVDGEDGNPICQQPSYSSVVLSALPALQVLDGGHVQIRGAFGSIEDELAKLRPDPSQSTTPPSEPWFSTNDLDVDVGNKKAASNTTNLQELESKIQNMLAEDCSHLLRKASHALTKAAK